MGSSGGAECFVHFFGDDNEYSYNTAIKCGCKNKTLGGDEGGCVEIINPNGGKTIKNMRFHHNCCERGTSASSRPARAAARARSRSGSGSSQSSGGGIGGDGSGDDGSGGSQSSGGPSGSATKPAGDSGTDAGCTCAVGDRTSTGGSFLFLVTALAMFLRKRRHSRRI